jgi:hypothetical protein
MSQIISWAVPDNNEQIAQDVRYVNIYKQTDGQGLFNFVSKIFATSDGQAKGASNVWVSSFEDILGLKTDIYQIQFETASGDLGALSLPGQGGYLERFHEIMDSVRVQLGDDDPLFYQLDGVPQVKWTGSQLSKFLISALREFNGQIMVTNYMFSNLPDDAVPVIEWGSMSKGLCSRTIKEIPNFMRYNDGVSFDLSNRPADYMNMCKWTREEFTKAVRRWKMSHRPHPVGLGSQRLPFRVTRPLSMLPNMKNVFGF